MFRLRERARHLFEGPRFCRLSFPNNLLIFASTHQNRQILIHRSPASKPGCEMHSYLAAMRTPEAAKYGLPQRSTFLTTVEGRRIDGIIRAQFRTTHLVCDDDGVLSAVRSRRHFRSAENLGEGQQPLFSDSIFETSNLGCVLRMRRNANRGIQVTYRNLEKSSQHRRI